MKNKFEVFLLLVITGLFFCSCNKLTQVPEPVNTITTAETFSTDATATSAIIGIYNDLISGGRNAFARDQITDYLGMSSDELIRFGGTNPFQTNTYTANNDGGGQIIWSSCYYDIYLANAAISTLPSSTGVTAPVKKQLIAEAKFFRAFCHFYLVNLYGDIPYVTSNSYKVNDTIRRKSVAGVYRQIVADLLDAQNDLPADYSVSNAERVRVNQYAATAMLARAYLYQGDWVDAEKQADRVISNTALYQLTNLNGVFLANSPEAILQLKVPNVPPYSTPDGNQLIATGNPNYYLTDQLLGAFEPGDQRKLQWVDTITYNGTLYYYPFKYKVQTGTANNITEYYTVLRLGEQYLIRAEARAQQGKLTGTDGAIADLNIIRERAGIPDLSQNLNQTQVLAAVYQERRIELFSEFGHRWLDLKRTGQADAVLGAIKPTWKPTAKLYPIPPSEILKDANLTQNPGY